MVLIYYYYYYIIADVGSVSEECFYIILTGIICRFDKHGGNNDTDYISIIYKGNDYNYIVSREIHVSRIQVIYNIIYFYLYNIAVGGGGGGGGGYFIKYNLRRRHLGTGR